MMQPVSYWLLSVCHGHSGLHATSCLQKFHDDDGGDGGGGDDDNEDGY